MRLTKENSQQVIDRINEFIKHHESRERLIIRPPYAHSIDRIEIYCTETLTNTSAAGEAFSGRPFSHVVTISQFNDVSNKAVGKVSYSYINEFTPAIIRIIEKIVNTL